MTTTPAEPIQDPDQQPIIRPDEDPSDKPDPNITPAPEDQPQVDSWDVAEEPADPDEEGNAWAIHGEGAELVQTARSSRRHRGTRKSMTTTADEPGTSPIDDPSVQPSQNPGSDPTVIPDPDADLGAAPQPEEGRPMSMTPTEAPKDPDTEPESVSGNSPPEPDSDPDGLPEPDSETDAEPGQMPESTNTEIGA